MYPEQIRYTTALKAYEDGKKAFDEAEAKIAHLLDEDRVEEYEAALDLIPDTTSGEALELAQARIGLVDWVFSELISQTFLDEYEAMAELKAMWERRELPYKVRANIIECALKLK